ncbi:unnamed protein product [Euphydryas editha]|uniref:Endonuclease/exonuclease/phosphatase domain-containing protein n=1 Tax=Euphydryas editha TaxID=104508 RepID=A0AAU9UFU7_EUPED|nr:unnamed protein product [Euphydryas editha]
MPDEDPPPPEELAKLVSHCESTLELRVATDCNGHYPLWGIQFSNERGRQLVEYLFTTNLNILNVGSEPTFVTRRCKTIVDITLATEGVSNIISNWHVSREASCSDHRWIRFNIEVNTHNPSPRRKSRKTDPALFKTMMESRVKEVVFPERLVRIDNIEKQVTCVHDAIVTCYHAACPLTTPPSGKPKAQPWWRPELERLRTKERRYLNRAMNTGADSDWDHYRDCKRKYKKRIRYRSSGSWRNYTTGIKCQNQANRVRKVLSNQPKQILGSLRRPDDTFTGSPEEAERLLLETYFPDCDIFQNMEWKEESTNASEVN